MGSIDPEMANGGINAECSWFPDPTHVIGLYPDLLPSDYRKQLHYPNPLPTLSGAELEKAHLALIDYLTQVGESERE